MRADSVQRRLRLAVSNLLVDDWRLLMTRTTHGDAPVYEPSVSFALAWHLRGVLERQWDVDCEYNRASAKNGDTVIKRDSGTQAVVRPDIIVHRRGLRGRDNNLLVIEVKTNEGRQRHLGGSLESARQAQHDFAYQHAVLLDLGLDAGAVAPAWTWAEPAKQHTDKVPLYSPSTLVQLMHRGRVEERRRYEPEGL